MKKLSDFEGAAGVEKAADILCLVMNILANPKNSDKAEKETVLETFTRYMKNSPDEMMKIFGILNEKENYTCNGDEALVNMLDLASDEVIVLLFLSQSQKRGATSSGSASSKEKTKK